MKEFCVSCNKQFEFENRGGMNKYIPKICSGDCFIKLLKSDQMGLNTIADMYIFFTDGRMMEFKEKSPVFRSNYETRFSSFCYSKNLNYKYEPYKFTLSNGMGYVPDFWLPQYNSFIEIKGLWEGQAKTKFKLFVKEFPFPTYLLDHKALQVLNK